MPPRVRALAPAELTTEQSALYTAITSGPRSRGPQHFALSAPDGSLRGPFDLMLRSPAVGAAQQELGAAIRYRTALTDRQRELAILLVAARWDSAFERESHEPVALAAGFGHDDLRAIRARSSRSSATTSTSSASPCRHSWTAICPTTSGVRHPQPSAPRGSTSSRRSSATTEPLRCSCGCSGSGEIAPPRRKRYGFTP
jgi:hypothetical protein